jgi:hypothetical protein
MIEPKGRELQAVRIEVAVNICITYPALYKKIFSKTPLWNNEKEKCAGEVLKAMLKAEPCIKNILSFYYKRM